VDFDGIGKEEFKKSVENIVGGIPAEKEVCRLCKFLMENGIIEKLESKT